MDCGGCCPSDLRRETAVDGLGKEWSSEKGRSNGTGLSASTWFSLLPEISGAAGM